MEIPFGGEGNRVFDFIVIQIFSKIKYFYGKIFLFIEIVEKVPLLMYNK